MYLFLFDEGYSVVKINGLSVTVSQELNRNDSIRIAVIIDSTKVYN